MMVPLPMEIGGIGFLAQAQNQVISPSNENNPPPAPVNPPAVNPGTTVGTSPAQLTVVPNVNPESMMSGQPSGPGQMDQNTGSMTSDPMSMPSEQGSQHIIFNAPPGPPGGMISLNFDDADVYTIIQTIFGEILRANYVIDPRVKGRVTFRAVSPVPIESVPGIMEVILRLNGIGVVEERGLYRFVPIGDIAKEPSPVGYGRNPDEIQTKGTALLQVVPILYISSADAIKLIKPFASGDAVLVDMPKANQIIIVDTDANVKRMLKLVEIFDNEKLKQRTPQIYVYPVQNSKAVDIAKLLQQIFLGRKDSGSERIPDSSRGRQANSDNMSSSLSSGMPDSPQAQSAILPVGGNVVVEDLTKIIPDEITNTITILATPEDYALIKQTIEQLDTVPRQVVIEGMIASVSLTDNLSLGLGVLLKGSIGDYNVTYGLNTKSFVGVKPEDLLSAGFSFVASDPSGMVRSLVKALATDSKAKLLAAPHILVSDNREARIQVGQSVPLITSETYGTPGVAPQRNIQYTDIGIILKVKPRINEGGLVALEIFQEVSSYSFVDPDAVEKQIKLEKTEAKTDLVVQDGQTIVIGGLIRNDTTKSRSGIPWLSKIPILGWLFGVTEDDKSRQELIILLTPHVIKNQAQSKEMTSGYIDQMTESSKGRIKREDMIREKPPKNGQVLPPAAPTVGPQGIQGAAPATEGQIPEGNQ